MEGAPLWANITKMDFPNKQLDIIIAKYHIDLNMQLRQPGWHEENEGTGGRHS